MQPVLPFSVKGSNAGMRAAPGRRRPAHDHVFIAYQRAPSPPPGTTPAPIEDAITLADGGGGGSWGGQQGIQILSTTFDIHTL